MKLPKPVETIVTKLNDLLASGQCGEHLTSPETLKIVDHIICAVAPEYGIVTIQTVDGRMLGFSAQKFAPPLTPTAHNATQ